MKRTPHDKLSPKRRAAFERNWIEHGWIHRDEGKHLTRFDGIWRIELFRHAGETWSGRIAAENMFGRPTSDYGHEYTVKEWTGTLDDLKLAALRVLDAIEREKATGKITYVVYPVPEHIQAAMRS